ncbi:MULTISPECIES: hypothetical protein [Rhodovulum]|uniref:Uncharacterized protein n=1 Tax=Rhodovulum visakhapatnamense TaxID=364297 RepID=A0ABS1RNL3_9RHOB|nr:MULTISPECIES: hypothetical protein [Rhodovulum]MBL3569874.1 hypothetical protein [Rhodovulum visakhapatnamense]MBL3580261.1 hypothetical protein [Rhodovulum visakhapatnamense]
MTATRFTEAQVRRAVKGATDAGWTVGEVRVEPDGTIRLLPVAKESPQPDERTPQAWD